MKREKISVIIPVYNAEKYLDNTLNDVIAQTYKNIEIIIINDGSSDKSLEIIEKYIRLDDRIKVISSENNGPSKARNAGLRYATGEYIRFIDADDRIPKDSMEKMIEPYIRDKEVDLVIGNYLSIPDKGYFTGATVDNKVISKIELVEMFLGYMKSFYFGVPWNKLYKRSIIQKYNMLFNEKIMWCEDFLFNIEYISNIKKAFLLNVKKGVYQYCIREEGITGNLKNREFKELQYTDELRYKVAKDFFCRFVEEDTFRLQWDNAELYKKLSIITKYRSDKIHVRYNQFVQLLQGNDVYKYINIKWKQGNAYEWSVLKKAIEQKKYLGAFCFFLIRGFLSRYVVFVERMIRNENVSSE